MKPLYYQPITSIPKQFTNRAIVVFISALLTVSMLFNNAILDWKWMLFGLVQVVVFFYFASNWTYQWQRVSYKKFAQNVFLSALMLRLIYVLFTYWFYTQVTGSPFGYDNGDATFYDEAARDGAAWIRDGHLNLMELYRTRYGLGSSMRGSIGYSDIGFPMYLSYIYLLTNNSILLARLLNCVWGAWTALLIYKIGVRNFGEPIGRMAGVLVSLMPSLWYYCGTQLKEVWMVFLVVLFVEQGDYLLRERHLKAVPVVIVSVIVLYMFMMRTALAAVMVIAFLCALVFSSTRIVKWGQRVIYGVLAAVFVVLVLFANTNIRSDFESMIETNSSEQAGNMQWRSRRENGNSLARYASASVFAPLIFTIPFPTIVETPHQEVQKIANGGNFDKNIISYFTIAAMFMLLLSGNWRKHILPLFVMLGYLVVLVFSNFAQSGRFHQPIVPFEMLFAAYAIGRLNIEKPIYRKGVNYWLILMFLADIAWSWFKLRGRGMA